MYRSFVPIFAVIAMVAIWPTASVAVAAEMAKVAEQHGYDVEVYTEGPDVNGCGISFQAVWINNDNHKLEASASVNFFFNAKDRSSFSAIKATVADNQKPRPVAYAWVQTQKFGRTTDVKGQNADDPMSFVGFKKPNPNGFLVPLNMATNGFVFGVNFDGDAFDNTVVIPQADSVVVGKLRDCMSDLQARLKATQK